MNLIKYGRKDGAKGVEADIWESRPSCLNIKIKGTNSVYDWVVNFLCWPYWGFHAGWRWEGEKLFKYLKKHDLLKYDDYIIMGHSAGGPVGAYVGSQIGYAKTKFVYIATINSPAFCTEKYLIKSFSRPSLIVLTCFNHVSDIVNKLLFFYTKGVENKYGEPTNFLKAHTTMPESWEDFHE